MLCDNKDSYQLKELDKSFQKDIKLKNYDEKYIILNSINERHTFFLREIIKTLLLLKLQYNKVC